MKLKTSTSLVLVRNQAITQRRDAAQLGVLVDVIRQAFAQRLRTRSADPVVSSASGPFDGDLRAAWLERLERLGGRVSVRPVPDMRVQHFPNPLPATLYPPPPGFDHDVPANRCKLTAGARAELDVILAPAPEPVRPQTRGSDAREDRTREFRRWRDDVVLPVLGVVVERLRAAGYGARIAQLEATHDQGFERERESVELRVEATATGNAPNPSYRPRGHVRYELSHDGSVELDVWPLPPSGDGRRENRRGTPSELTSEHVERHVIDMLQRLRNPA